MVALFTEGVKSAGRYKRCVRRNVFLSMAAFS